jgi:RNA polymerase sigma factor (sigma-70 family)
MSGQQGMTAVLPRTHRFQSHGVARARVSSVVSLPPFQNLLDAHGRDVQRFLIASVGRVDADDCYQETWIAALRAYPRLRDGSNLRSWIFTIAHRKAIDHVRSKRRRAVPVGDVPERAAPSTIGPQDDLWARVGELPPKQRTALALRYVADAPYPEISSVMGTSEEAARRNVHEALKRLRMEYRR